MNENGLRSVIATLFGLLKQEQAYSAALGNEIAALRNALDELSDGKFLPLLQKQRARMTDATAAIAAADSARSDEQIRQVLSGELF